VNKDISKDCGLKPVVCRINLIFTPMHRMKHAIILAKAIQRNKKKEGPTQKAQDEWLALIVEEKQ